MTEAHKAALVVENDELLGIVSFKDVMSRAIAEELPLRSTVVTSIMTENPESVTPETTIVQAMQIMHDNGFLTLPVCGEDGTICGVVDVMDLIYGAGGADGWRSIFDSAMEIDDLSDQRSALSLNEKDTARVYSNRAVISKEKEAPVVRITPDTPVVGAAPKPHLLPDQIEFELGSDSHSFNDSIIDKSLIIPTPNSPGGRNSSQALGEVVFKVVDADGHTYLIRCDSEYSQLIDAILEKIEDDVERKSVKLNFVDDEGDTILISSDDCLAEAVRTSRGRGNQAVKLSLTVVRKKSNGLDFQSTQMKLIGASGVAAIVGIGLMALMKPKR